MTTDNDPSRKRKDPESDQPMPSYDPENTPPPKSIWEDAANESTDSTDKGNKANKTPPPAGPGAKWKTGPDKKPRSKKKIFLALAIILLLLLMMAPTLVTTGPVLSLVVSKFVNPQLNGQVQVSEASAGWFTGLSVSGLKILDDNQQVVVECKQLQSELSVLDILRGNMGLGQTTVSDAKISLRRLPDGSFNLEHLVKPSSAPPSTDQRLPAISGVLNIENSGVIIQSAEGNPASYVDLAGTATIPDINNTIGFDFKLKTLAVGGKQGEILFNGNFNAFANRLINRDDPKANIHLELSKVDAAILSPLLPPEMVSHLAGQFDGSFTVDVPTSGPITITSNKPFTGRNFASIFPALGPEPLQSASIDLSIPTIYIYRPKGLVDWQSYRIKTQDKQAITLDSSLGSAVTSLDLSIQSLLALAADKAPGDTGNFSIQVSSNFTGIQSLLKVVSIAPDSSANPQDAASQATRRSLLRKGVTLTQGSATYDFKADLSPKQTNIQTNLLTKDIVAHNQATGASFSLKPISLDAHATLLPGGGALPNLAKLKFILTSTFANMDVEGDSLDLLQGVLKTNLSMVQAELGQVLDFGNISLAGMIETTLTSSGSLASADGSATMKLISTATDVDISGIQGMEPLKTAWAQATATATLNRGKDNFISSLNNGVITLQTGSPQSPSLNFHATTSATFSPAFTASIIIDRCNADLASLTRDYAPLFGFLASAKAKVTSGTFQMSSRASYAGGTWNLEYIKAQVDQLAIDREGQNGMRPVVMPKSNFTMGLAGSVVQDVNGTSGRITQLSVTESHKWIDISKAENSDFSFVLDKDYNLVDCSGQLLANLSINYVTGIRDNLLPDMGAGSPRVVDGFLNAIVNASSQKDEPVSLSVTTKIRNLIIQKLDGQTLPAQSATLTVKGSLARNGQTAKAQVNIQSDLLNLDLANLDVVLAAADGKPVLPLNRINSGNITLGIPDLQTLGTYAQGLIPGLKLSLPVSDGQTSELVTLTSGKVDLTGEISRTANALVIKVPSLKTSAIGFTRGTAPQQLDPISNFTIEASVQPNAAGTVDAMTVSAFNMDAGAVQVQATQTIKITGLNEGGTLAADGAIRVTGDLAKVNALATALTGKPLGDQLAGQFNLTSQITTRGDVITPNSDLTISDFSAGSGQNQFAEKSIRLTEEMVFNTAEKSAMIRQLEFNTASGQASVRGNVTDYDTDRKCNFSGTITYDAEKLLLLLRAIMPAAQQAQLENAVASGKYTRNFSLTGSYPAGLPFDQAIAKLKGELAFTLDTFNAPVLGTDVSLMDLKVTLANGVMSIVPAVTGATSSTARLNGGDLMLAGINVKFTPDGLRVNSPENLQVLRQVSMNPAFTNNVLGKFINPAFANPQTSRGLMDLSIVYCRNLSLEQFAQAGSPDTSGSANKSAENAKSFEQWQKDQAAGKTTPEVAVAKPPADPYGQALIKFNVTEVQLGNDMLNQVIGLLASGSITQQTLHGDIKDGQIQIANGSVTSDIPLIIEQKYTFRLAGGVDLQNMSLLNSHFEIPTGLIAAVRKATPQVQQYMPANITVPISGRISNPQIDKNIVAKMVSDLLVQASQKALLNGVIDRATPKNPPTPDGNTAPNPQNPQGQANPQNPQPGNNAQAQPAQPQEPDAVGGILNLLEQQRQKDKEKKRQKELEKQQQQNR